MTTVHDLIIKLEFHDVSDFTLYRHFEQPESSDDFIKYEDRLIFLDNLTFSICLLQWYEKNDYQYD